MKMGVMIKAYGDKQISEALAANAAMAEIRRLETRLAFRAAMDELRVERGVRQIRDRYARTWRPGPVASKVWGLIGLVCSRKGA